MRGVSKAKNNPNEAPKVSHRDASVGYTQKRQIEASRHAVAGQELTQTAESTTRVDGGENPRIVRA